MCHQHHVVRTPLLVSCTFSTFIRNAILRVNDLKVTMSTTTTAHESPRRLSRSAPRHPPHPSHAGRLKYSLNVLEVWQWGMSLISFISGGVWGDNQTSV